MTELYFSAYPGHAERHAQRRAGNPLFSEARRRISQNDVDEARRADELAHARFIDKLGNKLKEVVDLPEQVESDVILKLRAELDQLYSVAASLHGDPARYTDAIARMIEVLNNAVRANIGNDALAVEELEEQDIARAEHVKLLAYPLIADLLLEDSVIGTDELAATILSEADDEAAVAALGLLDPEQQQALLTEADALAETNPQAAQKTKLLRLRSSG